VPAQVSLAPREREVLQAIAAGLTPEQVAELLTISIHTVRTHLKNAMAKLNSRSKLEAVMLAIKHGLIELPD
jgi:DNA-binding CsgD family transcriptional regulator